MSNIFLAHASFTLAFLAVTTVNTLSKEMTFEYVGNGGNCSGCEWIAAEGEITPDSYKHFIAATRGGVSPTVYLNSPGGSLVGGILLGEAIRNAGSWTHVARTVSSGMFHDSVPGECLSACAFAFLGGVNRSIGESSIFGVHQFYDADALANPGAKVFTAIDVSSNQLISGLVLEYVVRMGADASVVALASKTPPTEMRLLTEAEMKAFRVIWDPGDFIPWKIEPYGAGVIAFSKSLDESQTITVFCDRKKNKKLMLSKPFSGHSFQGVLEMSEKFDVMGLSLSTESILIKVSGKMEQVTFSLPATFDPAPENGYLYITNTQNAPHVAFYSVVATSDGFFPAYGVAMRNCL